MKPVGGSGRRAAVLAVVAGLPVLLGGGLVAERGASAAVVRAEAVSREKAAVVAPFVEQGGMVPAGGTEGGGSGLALSADGNTLLNGGVLYLRSGSAWRQGPALTGANTPPEAALSGDGRTVMALDLLGGVSVFTKSGPRWATGPVLHGPGAGFGEVIALSANGNTALIAAPEADDEAGLVWMFTREGTRWQRVATPLRAHGTTGSGFGSGLALSADAKTALIGVGTETVVFTRSGSRWTQRDTLNLVLLGLSASGTSALMGTTQGNIHAVVAIEQSPSRWTIEPGPRLPPGNGLTRGALSGDGNTALLGDGQVNAVPVGAVWAFTRTAQTWTLLGTKLVGRGQDFQDAEFALSANGRTAVIGGGTGGQSSGLGAAWVFTR
jgi:hypothetical protein